MSERYISYYDKEMEYYYPHDTKTKKVLPLSETVDLLNAKDKRIAELDGALSMALDACYELDSHGAISENVNYARALELLKGGDE